MHVGDDGHAQLPMRGHACETGSFFKPAAPRRHAGSPRIGGKHRPRAAPCRLSTTAACRRSCVTCARGGANKEAPVVTLIAVTTSDPWRVLSRASSAFAPRTATTAKAAARMFERWPDVKAMAAADAKEVEKAIYPVGFYRTKAPQLVEMARRIRRRMERDACPTRSTSC